MRNWCIREYASGFANTLNSWWIREYTGANTKPFYLKSYG